MQKTNITEDSSPAHLLRQLDVPALQLFETIYKTRNLTAAGARLGLSQPAVSRGLARLRAVYGDPLFVRQRRGVAPTPYADSLVEPLALALRTLRTTLQPDHFEPRSARRMFTISISDIGERLFLPRLQQHFARHAPGLTLSVVAPSLEELRAGLAAGTIDLAAGFFPRIGQQFHRQRLFRERFIYVARRGHPVVKGILSREQQSVLPHVVAGPPGTEHASLVRKVLGTTMLKSPVALNVQSFLCVGPIVATTDLIAALPSNLAAVMAEHMSLQLVEPPGPIPGFEVTLIWHERFHRDPANIWLRQTFSRLFRDFEAKPP